MSENRILEKVQALAEAESAPAHAPSGKRPGAWEDAPGGEFIDKSSNLGVVVRRKIRGKPQYSYSIVYFDDRGRNTYLPERILTASRPVEEIVYLLIKTANEFITEQRKLEQLDDRRPPRPPRERRNQSQVKGLSDLAKKDAQGKEGPYVGKTNRKKTRPTP